MQNTLTQILIDNFHQLFEHRTVKLQIKYNTGLLHFQCNTGQYILYNTGGLYIKKYAVPEKIKVLQKVFDVQYQETCFLRNHVVDPKRNSNMFICKQLI